MFSIHIHFKDMNFTQLFFFDVFSLRLDDFDDTDMNILLKFDLILFKLLRNL